MKKKGLSAAKAKQILKDGYVKGRPLTEKQKKFFGSIADGATPLKKINGGWLDKYQDGGRVSDITLDQIKEKLFQTAENFGNPGFYLNKDINKAQIVRMPTKDSPYVIFNFGEDGNYEYPVEWFRTKRIKTKPASSLESSGITPINVSNSIEASQINMARIPTSYEAIITPDANMANPSPSWMSKEIKVEGDEKRMQKLLEMFGNSRSRDIQINPKYKMGGSLPGASGMMYTRTSGTTPEEPKKAQNGKAIDWSKQRKKYPGFMDNFKDEIEYDPEFVDFDSVRRAVRNVESLDGKLMWNPESTATGLYGQRFSEIKNDYPGTRKDFVKDTVAQNEFFKRRFYDGLEASETTPLLQDANDLYNDYSSQIKNFPYSKEDIAVLSNFIGRGGTRKYLGYAIRDGKPLAEALPNIYGPNAKQSNKTPEEYLEKARKYYQNGGDVPKAQEGKIIYGSPEYEKLYNEGSIAGVDADGNPTLALDEVVIYSGVDYERYPYYNDLSAEQRKYFNDYGPIGTAVRRKAQTKKGLAEDALAIPGQLLEGAMESMQTPQSLMVEGLQAIEGKDYNFTNAMPGSGAQRTTSDVYGFETTDDMSWYNPKNISNFVLDAVTDPLDLIGAGIAGDALKLGKGVKRGLKSVEVPKGQKAMEKVSDFVSDMTNMSGNQSGLPPTMLEKIKRSKEAAATADFIRQDLMDPETIRRAEALGLDPEIFEQARKNLTITSDTGEKSWYKSDDLHINIDGSQTGLSKENIIMDGVMGTKSPNFTGNEIGAHEVGHLFQDQNYWKEAYPKTLPSSNKELLALSKKHTPEVYNKLIKNYEGYSTRPTVPTSIDKMLANLQAKLDVTDYNALKNKKYFENANNQYGTDIDNAIERLPMFREYRQGMRDAGILKNKWDEITPEAIDAFYKLKPENRINTFMEINDANKKLLRDVGRIAPVGVGVSALSSQTEFKNGGWIDKYKDGGVIEDDRGQWAYPGEITKINSNNITMKGVNYPVLGISDTGDTKMMQPGKDYKFNGNSVTEYPMAKNGSLVELDQLTNFTNYNTPQPGGWLDKYN